MKKLVVILSLAMLSGQVGAIVVSDYTTATNAPSGSWDLNWDYIYRYKRSTATAVGGPWLLTAAHVADDTFDSTVVVNGTNYIQQEIIYHSTAGDPDNNSKADLALVRFDKNFPGTYPLYTGGFPAQFNRRLNAILVGYGRTGTVSVASFTDSATGGGVKRWGTQKIDGETTEPYDVGGLTGSTTNNGIQMLFSLGDTAYEAGVATYDSGGGTFVEEDGVWKLAGVNTVRCGLSPNYTGTFAVRIPAYEAWITNIVTATGDFDGDGLPNYWEQQYGSTTGLVPSADSDGDGFINEDEYVADTDPTDGDSSFLVGGSVVTLTNQTFIFNGSTSRQYQVYYTTNDLSENLWLAHGSPVAGSGSNSTITVTNAEKSVFYRLRVTLP